MKKRIVIGISGSSGVIYGIRALQVIKSIENLESHLVLSEGAKITLSLETEYSVKEVLELADVVYESKNLAASISSGSFKTIGMMVIPCSIKSLSGIVNSYNDNLLTRAADVTLKERRKLVIVVRETPLHKGHLELMMRLSDYGGVILPPSPSFYHKPQSILDIVDQTVGKVLDQFDIEHQLFQRWQGS
ncbi:MAG: 4-hydroxy-3-polyprenylbenzoate decarboxylase [bacterium]|jgi:4-hydroxy-3-polyprenylbenzoate decarboxylase